MQAESTRYIEIQVKSALTQVRSERMPNMQWSLNPYRGCKHGCVYCYARYTHAYLELDPEHDFAKTVFVKRNLVPALRADLRRRTWRREKIHIGTATDPYQPVEGRYNLTRGVLQVLVEQMNPAILVTKNTLAVRDLDIMTSLAKVAEFRLIMTITTLDERLSSQIEPDVPSPMQRLRAVRQLRQAGIPVQVAIAPILPGITDSESQLTDLIAAIYSHGVDIAFHQSLRMYSATRPSLFHYLQRYHPQLEDPYHQLFRGAQDLPRHYRQMVSTRIKCIMAELGHRRPQSSLSVSPQGQLTLGL